MLEVKEKSTALSFIWRDKAVFGSPIFSKEQRLFSKFVTTQSAKSIAFPDKRAPLLEKPDFMKSIMGPTTEKYLVKRKLWKERLQIGLVFSLSSLNHFLTIFIFLLSYHTAGKP
jgi:hypothetical protein